MNRLTFGLVLLFGLPALCEAEATERRRAPAPVNRCSAYGPDYTYVPQTGTCVRIGGRVRAEAGTGGRSQDAASLRSEGRLQIDTQTQTGAGPLRTYIDLGARTGRGRP